MKPNSTSVRPRRGRRVLRTVLILLGVFILGFLAVGAYEYYRLQPAKHFQTPKVAVQPKGSSTPQLQQDVFNVLLLGSDARPGDTVFHTDSMMVVHVDLNKHQYSVLSLPRDTRVYVQGYGYTKLTSVNLLGDAKGGIDEGVRMTIQTVSDLTGLTINYYAMTNYSGLQAMVNALGGIDMNVPFRVVLTHPWYPQNKGKVITPGEHFLNGQMVAEVVHERDSLPQGDYSRQKLQEEAILGMARTALEPQNLPKLPAFVNSVPQFLVATNMSTEDMLSLALAVKSFDPNQVKYYQLQGASERLYDDVLRAYNDQIVLDPGEIRQVVEEFDPSATLPSSAAAMNSTGAAG